MTTASPIPMDLRCSGATRYSSLSRHDSLMPPPEDALPCGDARRLFAELPSFSDIDNERMYFFVLPMISAAVSGLSLDANLKNTLVQVLPMMMSSKSGEMARRFAKVWNAGIMQMPAERACSNRRAMPCITYEPISSANTRYGGLGRCRSEERRVGK